MTLLNADDVRVELGVERVIETFGLQGHRRGKWFRLGECPRCHEKSSREAVAIELTTGRWLHHGHERNAGGECSGDLFDLVAACEGLDTRREFARVVARAGEIAGMATASSAADPEMEARVAQRLIERQRQDELDRARRQAAAVDAAAYWEALADRHDAGEVYLTRRGLDPYPLIKAGVVRFAPTGDVCVAIRAPSGTVTTVATRHLAPGDRPKVLVRRGTSTEGTMIDSIEMIAHGRDVVLVEGVVDALTAVLAWPQAVVLGANGAGNLAKIARAAITRIKLAQVRFLMVPHDDEPGIKATCAAARIATAAGLELERTLVLVELPAPDLNAAWCTGWRPQGASA